MMKRGIYNRPFLHLVTMGILVIGVLIAPLVADTYPIFAQQESVTRLPSLSSKEQSITVDDNVFQTEVSQKPRSEIITYVVQRGDTISTIAKKFSTPDNSISTDTIRWANDLTNDDITVGQELKMLPVTGLAYKVSKGDTIYTIAKKLSSDAQKIVDYPFNDFANPETFSLVEGQILIVPDGIKPAEKPVIRQPVYIAQAPDQIAFVGGGFHWPLSGEVTQGFSWYHPGIDIAGPIGTPIYASKAGVVAEASCGWNYGYGCHVVVSHGDGFSSLYAHMATTPNVAIGQSVNGGELLGYRGNTGRSTGPHTHFEIRTSHGNVNPLSYLQ